MNIIYYTMLVAAAYLFLSLLIRSVNATGDAPTIIVAKLLGAIVIATFMVGFVAHSKDLRKWLGKTAVTTPVAPSVLYKMPTKPRGGLEA